MIDPVTAIGLATTAFKGIKSAISAGRDIQDMAGQLGQWGKAISDLDFAAAKADKPPWYKKLGGGIQANAMEVWIHKKKADEMREELRSYISAVYGPSAWKEIVHLEGVMRKEQKEAVYAAQEMKENIIAWIFGIFLCLVAMGLMAGIVYWIGLANGSWQLRLVEIKRGRWALYDKNDRIIIITTNKKIILQVMQNKSARR